MKVKLLITEEGLKRYRGLTIPEPISLRCFERHILWNKIIIPEMKSKKNMLWNETVVKKSIGHIVTKNRIIDLISIDFEKPKYERADDEDSNEYYIFTETETEMGFNLIEDAKPIKLHPMFFDIFIHEGENHWCISESMTGCRLFDSDVFGITRKNDFIAKVKREAKHKVPSQVYKTIIKTIGRFKDSSLISPRYKLV